MCRFRFLRAVRATVFLALLVGAAMAAERKPVDVPLTKLLEPNHSFFDQDYGVTFTYLADWDVVRAFRWGDYLDKTTIAMRPRIAPHLSVSFFYQKFGREGARPADIKTWFTDSARGKEATRRDQESTYRNDPATMKYGRTASGLPKCSYVATFKSGSRTRLEYYLRIAGRETYVMILAQCSPSEIDALSEDIERMADTVQVP